MKAEEISKCYRTKNKQTNQDQTKNKLKAVSTIEKE